MQLTSDNPQRSIRDHTIAQQRIQGMTYREIAKANNVCIHTVGRVLNDTEIKDIVESGTRELVSFIPLAIDNYHSILTDKKHSDHYKVSKDCLQATGILPSHASSVTINNILNVQSGPNNEQIQRIAELIQARHDMDIDAIDAEYTDDAGNNKD